VCSQKISQQQSNYQFGSKNGETGLTSVKLGRAEAELVQGMRDRKLRGAACHFFFSFVLSAVFLVLISIAGEVKVFAEEWEESWLDLPFEVTGSYRANYFGRWNSEDGDDQQLFQYLTLHMNDIIPDKVSVHFLGRLSAELNGHEDGDDFFFDIYDTFDSSLNGRIYYLYADIKDPVFEQSNLRLGRMYSYEGETIFFTGAKYEQTIDRLRYYVQGGIWASNYESTDENDTIGGFGLDYQLLRNTMVGYDFLRVVDGELDDTYHDFNITQRFGNLKAYAQMSLLDNEPDDLNLFGTYYYSPIDLNLTAHYYTLLTARGRLTNQFSPLMALNDFDTENDDTVGTLFPFNLVNLSLYKGWGDRFATTAGFETRWMSDEDEQNAFNREYDRYFAAFEVWDFMVKGLTTSLLVEYWDVNGGEDSISAGIDFEKLISERLEVDGGFYYSRYRIRSTFAGENFSDEIETPELYGAVRYQLKENVELLARYEVENEEDLGTTHRVRLGVEIDF
jgi:hypothetical protein